MATPVQLWEPLESCSPSSVNNAKLTGLAGGKQRYLFPHLVPLTVEGWPLRGQCALGHQDRLSDAPNCSMERDCGRCSAPVEARNASAGKLSLFALERAKSQLIRGPLWSQTIGFRSAFGAVKALAERKPAEGSKPSAAHLERPLNSPAASGAGRLLFGRGGVASFARKCFCGAREQLVGSMPGVIQRAISALEGPPADSAGSACAQVAPSQLWPPVARLPAAVPLPPPSPRDTWRVCR